MHIEIRKKGRNWNWHFVNNGKITAFNDPSPTRQRAISRSKGVVTAAFKEAQFVPEFDEVVTNEETGVITIRWS